MNTYSALALCAVCGNIDRLAELGAWPSHLRSGGKLSTRIPTDIGEAAGFDAGIACALHLIPDDKQRLSAVLHGAYTPEAVAQVRAEAGEMDPDSETCWWLAANSLCREDRVDEAGFQNQIESFMALAPDAAARRAAALKELKRMRGKFSVLNGVAFVYQNGGLEGAYVAGHSWAVTWYHCRGSIWR